MFFFGTCWLEEEFIAVGDVLFLKRNRLADVLAKVTAASRRLRGADDDADGLSYFRTPSSADAAKEKPRKNSEKKTKNVPNQ